MMPRCFPLLWLAACSFGPSPEDCVTDQACRDAFGLGATCGDDGYCDVHDPHPRCTDTWPSDLLTRPDAHGGDLILGALFDGKTDQPQVRSARLAVSQVDASNGGEEYWLKGRGVGLVNCTYATDLEIDDLDYAGAAEEISKYLIEVLGVRTLVGPATSSQSQVVYPIAEERDVLVISPSATSVYLNAMDGAVSTDEAPGLFWRTAPPDDLQGFSIADDLNHRGVTNLAIVHHTSTYGTGLADVTADEFGRLGGTTTRITFTSPAEIIDAMIDVSGLDEVQEVLFISSEVEDIIDFLKGGADRPEYTTDPDPLEIFLADAASDPYLLVNTADAASLYAQIRGTRPAVLLGAEYDAFSLAYNIEYDEDPAAAVFAPFTYDATMLALYGTAWAHHNEARIRGTTIARGLRQISDTSLPTHGIRGSGYVEGVKAFAKGESLNLTGASGELDYDPVTGETANPIEVWVIRDGTDFEPVRVCEPGPECMDI